jgi:hypothetical protein
MPRRRIALSMLSPILMNPVSILPNWKLFLLCPNPIKSKKRTAKL